METPKTLSEEIFIENITDFGFKLESISLAFGVAAILNKEIISFSTLNNENPDFAIIFSEADLDMNFLIDPQKKYFQEIYDYYFNNTEKKEPLLYINFINNPESKTSVFLRERLNVLKNDVAKFNELIDEVEKRYGKNAERFKDQDENSLPDELFEDLKHHKFLSCMYMPSINFYAFAIPVEERKLILRIYTIRISQDTPKIKVANIPIEI